MSADSATLPALRDELALCAGGRLANGWPSWTLHDPMTGRYFRLGWLEFELLARWHLGDPASVAARVARETTLRPAADDVVDFAKFLAKAELLKATGPKALETLVAKVAAERKSPAVWAIKNYLFIRVRLWRPDAFLTAIEPALRFLYTSAFLIFTLAAGALGLFFVSRQWDTFLGSFPYFFTIEGAFYLFVALALAKMLHEFGHGLTAKRFGARVPSMGVAFMVLYPTLYTDTTAVYALPDRRKRLTVAGAGMAAELALACYALLAWSFLPDGPLRAIVFFWATSSWVLSLAVNLSPFLRFDGYYLFSDLIEVENLQERSFALARWRIRETLFGCGDKPPEIWPRKFAALLIGYAIGTWIYRFFLFLGIAILVYFLFFKALGILMFLIEIWWFILKPVVAEMKAWIKLGAERRMGRRAWFTFAALGLACTAAFVPWRTHVSAPALLASETRVSVATEAPGRLEAMLAGVGDRIAAGTPLARFANPDLDHRIDQAERRAEQLRRDIAALAQDSDAAARGQIARRELERATIEAQSWRDERDRLLIRAPEAGVIVEIAEPLRAGEWLKSGEFLVALADPSRPTIDAYVEEADLWRLQVGAAATLVFEDSGRPRLRARVSAIAQTSARHLPDPELASTHGGKLAVRSGPPPEHRLVPEASVYRVRLMPEGEAGDAMPMALRGTIRIDAAPESPAARIWRIAYGLAVRESGF
jgi:putative peptide zinc metalloprotease protein